MVFGVLLLILEELGHAGGGPGEESVHSAVHPRVFGVERRTI